MPPVRMRGDGRKAKNPKKTLLRLLSYMKQYTPTLIVVLLCVFATAFAKDTVAAVEHMAVLTAEGAVGAAGLRI